MANWKKVLVSGSAIEGTSLKIDGDVTFVTGSDGFTPGGASDEVLVVGTDGVVKSVTQASIQGVTSATFTITGSDSTNDTFNAASDNLIFSSSGDIGVTVSTTGQPAGTTALILDLPTGILSSSAQIATDISGAIDAATGSLATSVDALNLASSSYLVSASVIGTANEVEVTANGAQGIQIGLPDDVEITNTLHVSGSLTVSQSITADTLTLTGFSLIDNNAAVISGSNIFGNDITDTHQFTGSVDITGSLSITGISDVSASIAALEAGGGADNLGNHTAEQDLDMANFDIFGVGSLTASGDISSSNGDVFIADWGSVSASLASISESAATGDNLGDHNATEALVMNAFDIVNVGSIDMTGSLLISGSITASGNITSSDMVIDDWGSISASLALISASSQEGDNLGNHTAEEDLNMNNFDIYGVKNLTVNGTLTTINTENLNIEDQFILLNSGALVSDGVAAVSANATADKDGGIIVDFGGGSGSAFMYDAGKKAWGIKGTDWEDAADDHLAYNTISDNNDNKTFDFTVSVVSNSTANPTSAPGYGTSDENSEKGTMHINTNDGTIWIYS